MDASEGRTVALFSTRFLPYSQTFIYEEIRAHRRYDVDVFCKERMNADRFPYARINKPQTPFQEWIYGNLGYWPAFDRVLARKNHALVHAHFGNGAVYTLPYVKKHKLPLIVTFHGNDVAALLAPQRYQMRRWRYVLRAPQIMRQADLMLAVSKDLCNVVADLSGRPEAVKWYRIGIDLERFRSGSAGELPQIVMVGRFTEKKGHMYALKAFSNVIRQGKLAHFVLAGDGERLDECRAFVESAGIADRVTFAGVLTQEQTANLFASSDIALAPSIMAADGDREGSPMVVKEASASGLPVIGTRHAGIPEIVEDGVTGFLVDERDTDALSQRLIELIDNPTLRGRLGAAGRAKMEREFDLAKQVNLLESYYDSVL